MSNVCPLAGMATRETGARKFRNRGDEAVVVAVPHLGPWRASGGLCRRQRLVSGPHRGLSRLHHYRRRRRPRRHPFGKRTSKTRFGKAARSLYALVLAHV